MWSRLFGPNNSLLIPFDGRASLDRDELDARLDDVEAYYRFAKLGEVVAGLTQKRFGMAAVLFLNTKRRIFVEVLPELESRGIPVTVFADADIVGSNRLAADE